MSRPTLAAAAAANEKSSSQIGPAAAGFKRTPQLVGHIMWLNVAPPSLDYMLKTSAELPIPIMLVFPPVVARFRAARERVMVNGERGTVLAELCHFALWYFVAKGVNDILGPFSWAENGLGPAVRDMEREYAFEEGQLEVQLKEMEERRWKDELRRP
jgi:hypothetical protein